MSKRIDPRPLVLGTAFVMALGFAAQPTAADTALENARLAGLLRQLDLLERSAQASANVSTTGGARYHFDYARLHVDIARIRAGIQDYLSPPRAQPRDLAPLDGEYRDESDCTP